MKDSDTISDTEIEDLDIIEAHPSAKGGGFLATIDVSKNNTKILDFDPSAPSYRKVSGGLNIQGECSNERCEAYNKIVFCMIGYVSDYDIISDLKKKNIKCPVCHVEVYPNNYGFLYCEYKIDFTKWENKKKISNSVEGKAGGEFKILSVDSRKAKFTELIFNVTEYP